MTHKHERPDSAQEAGTFTYRSKLSFIDRDTRQSRASKGVAPLT